MGRPQPSPKQAAAALSPSQQRALQNAHIADLVAALAVPPWLLSPGGQVPIGWKGPRPEATTEKTKRQTKEEKAAMRGGVWSRWQLRCRARLGGRRQHQAPLLRRPWHKRVPAKRQPSKRTPARQTSQRPGEMTVSNPRSSAGLRPRGAGPHYAQGGTVEHRRSRAPQPRQIA